MLLIIESGIRGGISMITKRYSKANNKYMKIQYNERQKSKFMKYLDANNLYRWEIRKNLLNDNFQCLLSFFSKEIQQK